MADNNAVKQRYTKMAEEAIARNQFGSAGDYYKRAGNVEKSNEFFAKEAEWHLSREDYSKAAIYFEKADRKGEASACRKISIKTLSGSQFNNRAEKQIDKKIHYMAAKFYDEAGESKKAKECWTKAAQNFLDTNDYSSAIECYKNAKVSLSTLPEYIQERVLETIKSGDVKEIQGLAALVQTEEDELIFNEAHVGLVL
jgi:tetratricopeptide (TPR) repeat protein